ncbi:MAG: hypothetical protein E7541_03065 [Ruminococcaceae bacterium]|nr:hypothetical protein [Oscillospiraceae bacterium]
MFRFVQTEASRVLPAGAKAAMLMIDYQERGLFMIYDKIRNTLNHYYFDKLPTVVEDIRAAVFDTMDRYAEAHPEADSYTLKAQLYRVIADTMQPTILEDIPFAYETGCLLAYSDGWFNRGAVHANGWLYLRNEHLFRDRDPAVFDLHRTHTYSLLYTQCGPFVDMMHLGIPMKKLFTVGLRGVLADIDDAAARCTTQEERSFVSSARAGITALQTIAGKLADAADQERQPELAAMVRKLAWEPPCTMHEGLQMMAFIRKALGALEGMGFSSFGRPDVLLAPLYEQDIANGVSEESLLDLVSRFLLIWDCTLDRRQKLLIGNEYELENTLTLGGCDENGNAVYNGVTRLFITARDRLSAVYPKMMLRYSAQSPQAYLELISQSLVNGQNYSLFENDDVTIPALIKAGVEEKDARHYVVGGCWDALLPDYGNKFSGEYFCLFRPLEWMLHNRVGTFLENYLTPVNALEATTFEEFYSAFVGIIAEALKMKADLMIQGSQVWAQVNPTCALSALLQPSLPMRKDMTAGGIRYARESVYFTGFAEVVDSLYAIKRLCFDDKVCSLEEIIRQCREDWPDEALRQQAVALPSYGDGSEEMARFAGRFHDDLCALVRPLPTAYGGQFRAGYNMYTEIIWIGRDTGALPSGRHAGEPLSQGISPSRLQKECGLYDLLDGLRYIDFTQTAGNASMTVQLPAAKLDTEKMAALFRVFAQNGLQALQLNCINREDLLAAQKDPDHYGHIIVRICGFSIPFVLLTPEYQNEFITRNLSHL